jgi:hypothetical protein
MHVQNTCSLHKEAQQTDTYPEDEGKMVLQNTGILPHYYTVSQPSKTTT